MVAYFPIDIESISRRALRGYGPEDPEPLPYKPRRRLTRSLRARGPEQPRPESR
jgi:hypothetical protein